VSLLDTTLWTSSPETSARHIHTSSIRLMESHKPCTTGGFWHGAQARKARPLTTPDWMSSLFAMARSLRSTSFSIPNLLSGPRHPLRLAFASKRSSELQEGRAPAPAVQAGRAAWRIDNNTTPPGYRLQTARHHSRLMSGSGSIAAGASEARRRGLSAVDPIATTLLQRRE
jgi:hypothetical protein